MAHWNWNKKSLEMTNKTLNFQMLKNNLGSILTDHEKIDEFSDIWNQYDGDVLNKKKSKRSHTLGQLK